MTPSTARVWRSAPDVRVVSCVALGVTVCFGIWLLTNSAATGLAEACEQSFLVYLQGCALSYALTVPTLAAGSISLRRGYLLLAMVAALPIPLLQLCAAARVETMSPILLDAPILHSIAFAVFVFLRLLLDSFHNWTRDTRLQIPHPIVGGVQVAALALVWVFRDTWLVWLP